MNPIIETENFVATPKRVTPFEETITIVHDGRDCEPRPFFAVNATVNHDNGRTYRAMYHCFPDTHTHAVTGEEFAIWNVQLMGATHKDSAGRKRFLPKNAKSLRYDLSFIPCQLIRAYMQKHGYFD